MPDSWLADYSSCKQLCQDVAELINDRHTVAQSSTNATVTDDLIKRDLFNLKAIMEKLKLNLIKSAKSHSVTHGELERRQNLLDTLTTKTRLLNDAAENRKPTFFSSINDTDRTALLSTERGDAENFGNPWLESDECISGLSAEQFRQRQEQIIKEQDDGLDVLSAALNRQKHIGITIGNEADYQNELIDDIHTRIVNTDTRVQHQTGRIINIGKKSSTCALWIVIIILAIVIVTLSLIKTHRGK